ncbi:MAG: DNA translocase FtsK 4TM domain-containing protein, partial [Candidatus Omnitrophica bacterium]|nr:DNA translocase FtsK 4TM domain-containing protein [Candidatus Omnitrophota bacterium]
FGAYAIPLLIAVWGFMFLFEEKPKKFYTRAFGAAFFILSTSSVFSVIGAQESIYKFQKGGLIGLVFSNFMLKYLGTAGTFIAIFVIFLLSLIVTTDLLIFSFLGWMPRGLKTLLENLRAVFSGMPKQKSVIIKSSSTGSSPPSGLRIKTTAQPTKKPDTAPQMVKDKAEKPSPARRPAQEVSTGEKTKAENGPKVFQKKPYDFPSLDILRDPPEGDGIFIQDNLDENSRILEETLRDFDIEAKVVDVSKGPIITRYELEPARGVTINRISALSDNIALAMKAVSIRIVAPIPGKGTVGVEVPNPKATFVYLKEILNSKKFRDTASKLKLALGKDISGAPIVTDLDDMPHLLIAGATGSGKTICVNSLITTLLYNASPEELKFLMVDPKRVELAVFNDLPHLLAPVVTDPKRVSSALNWVVNEMERRFELFAGLGIKNIGGYKKREISEKLPILPYIIVIIDELADLMLVAQQEVENMITRLAQLSRAVGIHMVIATQRPSVDVITGVIKANFPARISFKVASKVDSRTVIDMNGAEKLLGKGDMLFIEPGNPKPIRAQGTLVTDEEIARITTFIKSQRKPEFEEDIIKGIEKPQFKTFEKDEVYEEAVKLVIQTRQASVSMLQRRLGVGYTRAARLVDMMESEGIVGPYQGSKPREILIDSLDDRES